VRAEGDCTETFLRGWENLSRPDQKRINKVVLSILKNLGLGSPGGSGGWHDRREMQPGSPDHLIVDHSLGDYGVVYQVLDAGRFVMFWYITRTGDPPHRRRRARLLRMSRLRSLLKIRFASDEPTMEPT
jgi:hypothetical protein